MLARLCSIPGIADARVECSGTFFAISTSEQSSPERVLREVMEVLGPDTRHLASDEAGAQLAARARGELWFSAEGIRGLSYVEGRIITGRAVGVASQAVALGGRDSERLREAIRVEVFAALDRVHDEGGRSSSGWFGEEWPHIVDRVCGRLAGVLSGSALAVVAERLLREFG